MPSEGPIPLADDSRAGMIAAEAAAATASGSMFAGTGVGTALEDHEVRPPPRLDERPQVGFWEDVGWSFLFFTSPHSLVIFGVVWGISAFGAAVRGIPLGGWAANGLAALFVTAWYMNIITETAGGDDDLPKFAMSNGWWDDVIWPAFQYTGTKILIMLPAVGYALFISGTLGSLLPLMQSGANWLTLVTSGGGAVAPLVALICAGLFLWPAALMCVSMGGLSSLVRIDLIVTSVVNTFLPYSAIVAMVGATTFLPGLLIRAAAGTAAGGGLSAALWLTVVACGVEVYFSVIVMRLIGLYYRHFKQELAWDWE